MLEDGDLIVNQYNLDNIYKVIKLDDARFNLAIMFKTDGSVYGEYEFRKAATWLRKATPEEIAAAIAKRMLDVI